MPHPIWTIPLVAIGFAVRPTPVEAQEDHSQHAGMEMATAEPGASDAVTTVADEGGAVVITIGPVDLPAMADADHGGHHGIFPPVGTIEMPVHGYLYGFEYEVVGADGSILPRDIIHHFNVIDPIHRELFLPISQRMMAAGKETGDQKMPSWLLGYPVYLGQPVVVSAMLHNPTGVEHLGASVRIRLLYTKVGRPWPFLEVFPFQLDVAFPAGDKSWDLPPGESSKSWEGSPAMGGRIMAMGSHFHQYATRLTFEDVTTGRMLWEGFPILEDGDVVGVTIGRFYLKGGLKIHPDRMYRVTVHYDNPTGDTLMAGGMGVAAGVFMPTQGGAWPRVDESNPLYVLDRRHYMRVVRGTFEVISTGGGVIGETSGAAVGHDGHR